MAGTCITFQKRIIASGLLALLGFGGVFSQTRPGQAIKSAVGTPPQKPVDVGKQIIFSTMNVVGERCAMIYGGPSLGAKDFIIQDCGGPRWTNRWNFSGGYVKAMSFVDDRSGWFVVGRGLLKVEKLDWGLQGTVVRNEPDENIENVFFASQQYGWICGDKGMIRKTEDGGITWKLQETATDANLKKVRFINSLEGWATGGEYRGERFQDILLITKDGGAKWNIAKGAKDLSPVFYTSPRHGCGIDDNDAVRCTNDGERWRVTYSDNARPKAKRDIFFLNDKQGWIAGDAIWRTTDGGETWQEQLSLPDQSHGFQSVVFLDDQLGWAQELDAVWRTSNGGETWSKVSDAWISRMREEGSSNNVSHFRMSTPKRVSLTSKPYLSKEY
jgi:photosystem II stability/assembly factor-like uncharacterized protein